MVAIRGAMRWLGSASAFAALLGAPTLAAATTGQIVHKHRAAQAAAFPFTDSGLIGSFTPAAADPKLSGAFGRLNVAASGFRFTPSTATGNRRAVTIAVRARAVTRADAVRIASVAAVAPSLGIAPSAYSLGAAIGWKRFAVSGDYSRFDAGLLPGGREAADIAVSYGGRAWSTRLAIAGERTIDTSHLIGAEQSVSVDLAGSYALSHNLDVTGGVRYRVQRDHLDLSDERRDSQAVYVGTAFRF